MACNVVAVPYPSRGHVNVMMNLCNLLLTSHQDLLVTFVLTEEWLGLIGSDLKSPRIRFVTIPNVLPLERDRAADIFSFIDAMQTKMEGPFERILDQLESLTSLIVADTFLNWAVDVGNRRNIPVASLWPMPASVFLPFHHFDLLVRNGDYPLNSLIGEMNDLITYLEFRRFAWRIFRPSSEGRIAAYSILCSGFSQTYQEHNTCCSTQWRSWSFQP